MKRKSPAFFLLLAPILLSCSPASEGGSLGSPVYTVRFVDEEGTSVGYAYVIEGKRAVFKSNDDEDPYDFLPKAHKRDDGNNASYYVFDDWEGEYDSSYGESDPAVNINNIRHDCTLKATFKRETYSFLATYRSEMQVLGFKSTQDRSIAYSNGVKTSFYASLGDGKCEIPYDFLEDNPSYSETHRFYYENVRFDGWNVVSSDGKAGQAFNYAFSSRTFSFDLLAKEWSREEGPSEDPASFPNGCFLLNSSLNENGQPDYPTFFSNGEAWVSLGLLSRMPTLYLDAAYEKSNRSFSLSVVKSEEDAIKLMDGDTLDYTPQVLSNLPYGTRLEVLSGASMDTLRYGEDANNDREFDSTPSIAPLGFKSPIGEWRGFCYGFSNYGGHIPSYDLENDRSLLSFDHMIANTVIYPLGAVEEI